MKLIHCADIHLDSRMSANLSKEKARERKAELLATFRRMVEYAEKEGIRAIVIAGDLFDTSRVSATARNLVRDTIVTHPGIDFYYLQGNHDEGSFLAGLEEKPANLFLFGDSWVSYPADEAGNVVITGVELNADNAGSICNTLVLDPGKINIVVLHGQESEHKARDKAQLIHLAGLRNKGIDYLALGHIHSYHAEKLDGRGCYCYPGCLEGRGFDECGEHGFVVLETDEAAGTVRHRFVPFAARNLYTIPVDISACASTADILEEMKRQAAAAAYPEKSMIKFELVGNVDVQSEKELEFLQKQFADSYYYVRLKDSSRYRVDYSAYELDMSLKGEFIRTVKACAELSEEEKAAVIHYGIQALAGEEILEV